MRIEPFDCSAIQRSNESCILDGGVGDSGCLYITQLNLMVDKIASRLMHS